MPFSFLARRSPRASKSFLIGLGQMILMSVNVRNMAGGHLLVLTAFTVVNTYVWIFVVRSAVHSTGWERFAYAIGSAGGAAVGVAASQILLPYAQLAGL